MELSQKLLVFSLITTRITAFFLFLPVLGGKNIPTIVRAATIILVSIFFLTAVPPKFTGNNISAVETGLLIFNESIYGLAIGLIASIMFGAVRFGAHIIEQEMGLTMAEILDPFTDESAQPLGMMLEMIFILLFLSAKGHHLFLLTLSRSFETFPIGTIPTIQILTNSIIKTTSTMFMVGLRIAAPMLAASILLMVVLAILARIVPEMNILFISFPLRIGMGLGMAAIFLPLLNEFVSEFADWMTKLTPL